MCWRILSQDTIYKIREMVSSGLSKYRVSLMLGISYLAVRWFTRDIPSKRHGNHGISDHTLKMLQNLIKDGYFMPEKGLCKTYGSSYITLYSKFPVRRLIFKCRTIYFLEGREEDAMRAFIKRYGKRVTGFGEVKELQGLFGLVKHL